MKTWLLYVVQVFIHYTTDIYACFTIVPEGPPINLAGTSFSTTSINLDWLPVSEELRNGVIRKYEAFIYGAYGYNEQMTVQAPTRTAVFEGLVIFSNYSLKVRAFTRKGPGPWSSLINTTTSAGGMFLVTSSLNFCRPAVLYTLPPVIRRQIQDSCFFCLGEFFFFRPKLGNLEYWIPDSPNDWNPESKFHW